MLSETRLETLLKYTRWLCELPLPAEDLAREKHVLATGLAVAELCNERPEITDAAMNMRQGMWFHLACIHLSLIEHRDRQQTDVVTCETRLLGTVCAEGQQSFYEVAVRALLEAADALFPQRTDQANRMMRALLFLLAGQGVQEDERLSDFGRVRYAPDYLRERLDAALWRRAVLSHNRQLRKLGVCVCVCPAPWLWSRQFVSSGSCALTAQTVLQCLYKTVVCSTLC